MIRIARSKRGPTAYTRYIHDKVPVSIIAKTWVDAFGEERWQDVIERNAQATVDRLSGFNIDYYWIGGPTHIEEFKPGNWFRLNKDHFPKGLEWTCRMLEEKNITPGLWIAPFWMMQIADDGVAENKDNLLMLEDGSPALYGRKWQYRLDKKEWPYTYIDDPEQWSDFYRLDPSHPKAHEFLKKVFKFYYDIGIRYYMIDFLDSIWYERPFDRYHDMSLVKGPELYRKGIETIRKSVGDETYLLSSSGPTFHNVGYVDSARISSDFGEGRPIIPWAWFYPASYVISSHKHWTSCGNTLQNMATVYFTHQKLYANNCNCLVVDKPISRNEAEIHASIFGISGSPIMLADELSRISEDRLKMIKKLLPQTTPVAKPVDLFTSTYPESYPKVFRLEVSKPWGEWSIVAVFNLEQKVLEQSLTVENLGVEKATVTSGPGSGSTKDDDSGNYWVYDFWQERYCGTYSGSLEVQVPPFSCRVFKVQRTRRHPWLLSTDMHFQQGNVEIDDLSWDEKSMTLSGTAVRPKGENGSIFLVAPKGYKTKGVKDLWVAKNASDENLVVRKDIVFDSDRAAWKVEFERA